MSTGPGHVGRAIEAAFAAKPGSAFCVDELCWLVYRGADQIFFELGSVKGYALARLKATNYAGHSETELRAKLSKGGFCHELVAPGGDWYRQVKRFEIEEKAG